MVQATTPTFILTLPNTIDLSQAESVYFSIEQDYFSIHKQVDSVSENIATVSLTQEETVNFDYRTDAKIQLNWVYSDGSRAATKTKTVSVDENLLKDVIE